MASFPATFQGLLDAISDLRTNINAALLRRDGNIQTAQLTSDTASQNALQAAEDAQAALAGLDGKAAQADFEALTDSLNSKLTTVVQQSISSVEVVGQEIHVTRGDGKVEAQALPVAPAGGGTSSTTTTTSSTTTTTTTFDFDTSVA